jgi:hypothetical protein
MANENYVCVFWSAILVDLSGADSDSNLLTGLDLIKAKVPSATASVKPETRYFNPELQLDSVKPTVFKM